MHELDILADFVIILALSLVVVWSFHKLRLPAIVGFLAAGALVGPGGLEVVASREDINLVAEIGVVLLLFSIGLEFSLKELVRIRRLVVGAGGLQVVVVGVVVAAIAWAFGARPELAIFLGALVALSSTAIVLSLLYESGELYSVHGQSMLGILILQDLAVVPLILLTPLLGGQAPSAGEVGLLLAKAAGVIVGLWLMASYLIPYVIERVLHTRQREMFTVMVVLIAVGTAYLSGLAGLSLALGAFLAGLVLSESPYSHQMLSEVLPFRDVFNSLFFVSVGMLFDPSVFAQTPWMLGGLLVSTIALKAVIIGAIILLMGYGLRVAILVGLGLAQVGEFAFVLAREGQRFEILAPDQYSMFLGVSVLTMAVTPLLFKLANWVAKSSERVPSPRVDRLRRPHRDPDTGGRSRLSQLSDHVIIVGYGVNGQSVAAALARMEVAYVIVEMNPATVAARADEEPIYFGDAARGHILHELGVERAHALVVTVGDAPTSRRVVSLARQLNPRVYIAVRTRYSREIQELYNLGASEVVPEEYEASISLVGVVMESYGASPNAVLTEKERIRRERYGKLSLPRGPDQSRARLTLKQLVGRLESDIVRVRPDSPVAGCSLRQLDLRAKTGATVAGLIRSGELIENPGADAVLEVGDELVVVGRGESLSAARKRLLGHEDGQPATE